MTLRGNSPAYLTSFWNCTLFLIIHYPIIDLPQKQYKASWTSLSPRSPFACSALACFIHFLWSYNCYYYRVPLLWFFNYNYRTRNCNCNSYFSFSVCPCSSFPFNCNCPCPWAWNWDCAFRYLYSWSISYLPSSMNRGGSPYIKHKPLLAYLWNANPSF